MRREPAVLIAAASSSLNQAISPALSELPRASMAIRVTAKPALTGSELRIHLNMALTTSKELERPAGLRARIYIIYNYLFLKAF